MSKVLNVLAIIALVLGVAFVVLPMGSIAFLPGGLALIFALLSYFLDKKGTKKLAKILSAIAVVLLLVVLVRVLTAKEEVATDAKFEQVQQQSEQENIQDLEGLDAEADSTVTE